MHIRKQTIGQSDHCFPISEGYGATSPETPKADPGDRQRGLGKRCRSFALCLSVPAWLETALTRRSLDAIVIPPADTLTVRDTVCPCSSNLLLSSTYALPASPISTFLDEHRISAMTRSHCLV